ncbi:two-component system histidine kinase PnpS [Virgibacillus xinjiangensis]|uniref:histidine kinase n=1 Tax=Virgibacillus xinjiangensis TaxID=393090 RepID=A0ABV7CUD9_9BACI
MSRIFTRAFFPYIVGFTLAIILTTVFLAPLTENKVMLISVLAALFVTLLIMLLHFQERFIKPMRKVTETLHDIARGNYRARVHFQTTGDVAELSNRVNQLARYMSEISIQEKMRSEQLASVIDNTESGLVLIDEKGYIHLVNSKFLSIFGKREKDYNGYLYHEVIDNEIIHQTVHDTFLYEKNVKEEFSYYNGGVDKNYLEVLGVPIFSSRNRLKGAVLVLYDITELKKLEGMRKDFVANVSHELKTPITSIKGFAETLLDGGGDDAQVREEFLQIIYKESDRLQLLIDDLLRLSQLEKEGFQLAVAELDMHSLVGDILPPIKHKAEREGLEFSVEIEEDVKLEADEEKVKQILINLLDNAFNYTPEQGEVWLRIAEEEEYVHIQVEDTGIGIAKEALPRIFERFYRVDKARSRNTGGTGLGLAIVKHIVEVHEGLINIKSELNEGTAIHVYLPKQIKA